MTQFSSGKHGKLIADSYPYRVVFGPWAGARMQAPQAGMTNYEPRPDLDRPLTNPANPVLRLFRNSPGWNVDGYVRSLSPGAVWQWEGIASPESIAHARAVLERLARFTS